LPIITIKTNALLPAENKGKESLLAENQKSAPEHQQKQKAVKEKILNTSRFGESTKDRRLDFIYQTRSSKRQ